MEISINYWAVLVAAVVQMVVGSLWFSPLCFAKQWMASLGMNMADMDAAKNKGMAKTYLAAFVSSLVMAYVLAHFAYYTLSTNVADGLQLGFWVWLGFAATVLFGAVLWEKKSLAWFYITASYYLVSLLISGVILSVW